MSEIQIAAANSPVASAGAGAPIPAPARPVPWVEAHIARRNAARAFLAAKGMEPYRQPFEQALTWSVPRYTGRFDDHELVALAKYYGWQE